jgi:hypothetical protein
MDATTIDLRKRIRSMGSSYDPLEHNTYTGYCKCGEEVGQDVKECPACGGVIIWFNSDVWKTMYGSPKAAQSQLTRVNPTDAAGVYLLNKAKLSGFASQGEYDLWLTLTKGRKFPYVRNIIDSTAKWKGGISGRGLVTAVMNRLAKTMQDGDDEGETIVVHHY